MKRTIDDIRRMKRGEKIAMITCYDYSFARAIADRADMLLVGDSLGNVVLGFDRTRAVTMADMCRHVAAVRRGAPGSLIVADLPFGSYESADDAVSNAKALLESGADAVKPEGRPDIVHALVSHGIAVVAHVGLLPQTATRLGVAGSADAEANEIRICACAAAQAGAFAIVLECLPADLARTITEIVDVPTIGIGAGPECDGQVLVLYDLLGLFPGSTPKFVRRYADVASLIGNAVATYAHDVKSGAFPDDKESYR